MATDGVWFAVYATPSEPERIVFDREFVHGNVDGSMSQYDCVAVYYAHKGVFVTDLEAEQLYLSAAGKLYTASDLAKGHAQGLINLRWVKE